MIAGNPMHYLSNSYVLGFSIVGVEIIANNILSALDLPHISGIILAFVAGYIYATIHKEVMPRNERLKALGIYILMAGITGLLVMKVGAFSPLLFGILVATLLVYTALMYFSLGFASSTYMSAWNTKQKALLNPGAVRDPLTPDPTSTEFRERHPRVAFTFSFFCSAIFVIAASLYVLDPLSEPGLKYLIVGTGVFFAGIMGVVIWKIFGRYRVLGLVVLLAAIVGLEAGVYAMYARMAPPSPAAKEAMVAFQVIAQKCVAKGAPLRGGLRGLDRGIPQVESALCQYESNWKRLPSGWAFNKIEDADVSDATYMFSARSRAGETIICTERGCKYSDTLGAVTELSTSEPIVVEPAAASNITVDAVVPEGGEVRAGERVEVLLIAVKNSSSERVDLIALWYKKTGSALDSTIEAVFVEEKEGERIYGQNHLHHLPEAQDGMVPIHQPNMFVLEPGEMRTYRILMELADDASSGVGSTVGLDLSGFSYEKRVSGMPSSGAVYTIVR
ncbi:MAG: hypothetical protein WAZ27_03445 [Minisyncoccia bacterium]